MGIKAPSCMTGLASAANTFGQSVKKAGVAAYNKLDRFAEKRPLVAAVGGLAMILLGAVSVALVPPVSLALVAAGGGMIGLGLKHLIQATKPRPEDSLFLGQKYPNDEDSVFSVNKQF